MMTIFLFGWTNPLKNHKNHILEMLPCRGCTLQNNNGITLTIWEKWLNLWLSHHCSSEIKKKKLKKCHRMTWHWYSVWIVIGMNNHWDHLVWHSDYIIHKIKNHTIVPSRVRQLSVDSSGILGRQAAGRQTALPLVPVVLKQQTEMKCTMSSSLWHTTICNYTDTSPVLFRSQKGREEL